MRFLTWRIATPVLLLLALLIATDFGFMLMHSAFKLKLVSNPYFLITKDFGFGEVFMYIKEFWIMGLLLSLWWVRRFSMYLAWAAVYLYLLADDSLQIHEGLGGWLVATFNIQSAYGLRGQDFGELLVTAGFGMILFCLLAVGFWFADRTARRETFVLLVLTGGIGFFGVVVDMLHSAAPSGWVYWIFGLAEDGGEMVLMSLVLAFVFMLVQTHDKSLPAGVTQASATA